MSSWNQLNCRTRVVIWLGIIFVLLRVSDLGDWVFLQHEFGAGRIAQSGLRQLVGTVVVNFLVTTALLIGIGCRVKGMRGFLLAWFGISVTAGCIAIVAKLYDEVDFSPALPMAVVARSLGWMMLIFAKDIHYFLSYNYDDRTE